MEQREAMLWTALIMVFIGIITAVFMRTDHPVSGNAVLSTSCGTLERAMVEQCHIECSQNGQCAAYENSCATGTFACACITCSRVPETPGA